MHFTVPEQVEELIVIEETNSTIIVNWTDPTIPNGVIIEYEVCYWRLGDNCTEPISLNNTDMSEVSIQELGKLADVAKLYIYKSIKETV